MEKNASILVVDDDKEIADLVEIYLVNDGYQVLKASDGEQCLQTLKEHPEVRMLILDIMMQGIDGFHPLELLARVKSQMKRYTTIQLGEEQQPASKDEIEIQDLTINKAAHVVKKNGKEVALTPIEFDILYLLASNRDRVFSTDEIFEKVWNEKVYEVNNTVMVHIRRLREKIEDNSRSPKILKTVWGVGYKIEG